MLHRPRPIVGLLVILLLAPHAAIARAENAPPEDPPAAAAADIEAPDGTLIEAEDPRPASDSQVVQDAEASGGAAVTATRAWEPVFTTAALPVGDRFRIHVRHRGGPLLVKGTPGGEQKDLGGVWSSPPAWEWTDLGTFAKSDVGDHLLAIRTDSGNPEIDCVVVEAITADTPQSAAEAGIAGGSGGSSSLPPDRPREGLAAETASLTVDWSGDEGRLDAAHWGVSLFHPVEGLAADDAGYLAYLKEVRPSLLRMHHAALGWFWMNRDKKSLDDGKPAWDVEVIRRALAPVQGLRDAGIDVKLLLNHGYWPTWFSEDKVLDRGQWDAAAALTRELVEAVASTGVRVDGWEILNEADNAYEKGGRYEEMCDLFITLADAVREADPAARIGGPSLTWAKPAWVEPFLDRCGDRIDFFTWHNYASGEPTMPNEKLFGAVETIGGHARYVEEQLQKRGLDRVETYLTEFNVQWTWAPYERRHANSVGAAFQAAAIARLARSGITGVTVWQDKGNAYGLIDAEDRMRATGQLYALARHLTGRIASAEAPDGLDAVPLVREDGGRTLLLIRTAETPLELTLPDSDGWRPTGLLRIDADGLLVEANPGGRLTLPGWSVTVLTDAETGLKPGRQELPAQHASFGF